MCDPSRTTASLEKDFFVFSIFVAKKKIFFRTSPDPLRNNTRIKQRRKITTHPLPSDLLFFISLEKPLEEP